MTVAADILGYSHGLASQLDGLMAEVRLGARRFWRGGDLANAPAGEKTMLLNRLLRILRWTFVLLATRLKLAPLRPRGPRPLRRRQARRPACAPFPLFARYVVRFDTSPRHPQPAGLARNRPRDRTRTVIRKLEAIARALANPLPIIRRMARKLPDQLMVFGWRPPRRPPPTDKREFHDELVWIFREARHNVSAYNRRMGNIERAASGS